MNSHVVMRGVTTGYHRCRDRNDPKLDWNLAKTQCWFKGEKDKEIYDVVMFTSKSEGSEIKRTENEKLNVKK